MKKALTPLIALFILGLAGCATSSVTKQQPKEDPVDVIESQEGIVLKGEERLTTPRKYKAPVEITIVAKTDSTNLRMGYAAKQVIFNWEHRNGRLRLDGGPGGVMHKDGAGKIPVNEYVTIRWVVTPKRQSIYVNDELRFEHAGNYSKVNNPVTVFSANGSTVTVKSVKVKQLGTTTP